MVFGEEDTVWISQNLEIEHSPRETVMVFLSNGSSPFSLPNPVNI